jgi:hypothetical protein
MDFKNITNNHNLLEITSNIWKDYLDNNAYEDLKNRGFYSIYKKEYNLNFILLNT